MIFLLTPPDPKRNAEEYQRIDRYLKITLVILKYIELFSMALNLHAEMGIGK